MFFLIWTGNLVTNTASLRQKPHVRHQFKEAYGWTWRIRHITKWPDSLFCCFLCLESVGWGLGIWFSLRFLLAPNLCRSDYPKRQGVFLILHAYLMTFPRSFRNQNRGAGWYGMCSDTPLEDSKLCKKLYPERIRKADVREIVLFSELDVSCKNRFPKIMRFCMPCYPWNSFQRCEFFMVSFAPAGC